MLREPLRVFIFVRAPDPLLHLLLSQANSLNLIFLTPQESLKFIFIELTDVLLTDLCRMLLGVHPLGQFRRRQCVQILHLDHDWVTYFVLLSEEL